MISVDKAGLLHSINGLHRGLQAGKSLRSACTVLGQQIGFRKNRLFYTSDAVDMQRLFHSRIRVTAVRQALLPLVLQSGLQLMALMRSL